MIDPEAIRPDDLVALAAHAWEVRTMGDRLRRAGKELRTDKVGREQANYIDEQLTALELTIRALRNRFPQVSHPALAGLIR